MCPLAQAVQAAGLQHATAAASHSAVLYYLRIDLTRPGRVPFGWQLQSAAARAGQEAWGACGGGSSSRGRGSRAHWGQGTLHVLRIHDLK